MRYLTSACLAAILLVGCGGSSSSSSGGTPSTPVPPSPPSNAAPKFTSETEFTFSENQGVQFTLSVTDDDAGDTVTISDNNSGDGALFTLDPNTGNVTANPFNFEDPQDVNADNVYEQVITLSDGKVSVQETIRVTIEDVDEAPEFKPIPRFELSENQTGAILTFEAVDPEGASVSNYQIGDVIKFGETVNAPRLRELFSVDAQTGVLTLEIPLDAEQEERIFEPFSVNVSATDGNLTGNGAAAIFLIDTPGLVTSGLRYSGVERTRKLGEFAGPVGDVDGDGIEEVWITEDSLSPYTSHLIWGKTIRDELQDGVGDKPIDDLSSPDKIKIILPNRGSFVNGQGTNGRTNIIARSAGDVDGDGVNDVLIGFRDARERRDIPDEAASATAAILWGNALNSNAGTDIDLENLEPNQGVILKGLTQLHNLDLSLGTGEFDGDMNRDILLGTFGKNEAYLIFGDSIANAKSAGELNVSMATSSSALRLRSIDRSIQQIGADIDGLDDVDGDGFSELVTTVDTSFGDDIYVISGAAIMTAKGGDKDLDIQDDAISDNVVLLDSSSDVRIQDMDIRGDIDNDGFNDIAVALGTFSTDKIALIMPGAKIREALINDTEINFQSESDSDAITIRLDGERPYSSIGANNRISVIPNFTAGAGDELAFSSDISRIGSVSFLNRFDPGVFYIITDTAITGLASHELVFPPDAIPANVGRILVGPNDSGRVGASHFFSDLDNDGIADLSMASESLFVPLAEPNPTSGRTEIDNGAYLLLPGTNLQDVFSSTETVYNMADALAKE